MKDEIVIAQALDGRVRIHAANTTALCEEGRKVHNCMPTSAAAFGRVMTVTAIMASDLKNPDEKIVSVINGHGPAGTVLVQADGKGNVRGFIGDPNIYMVRNDGHLAVGHAIGTDGTLTVTKDLGLKEPFSGMVRLQTGEIGEDFAYYFTVSEQTPSAVSVGVLVSPEDHITHAGGMIFQLLPDADEESISACEKVASVMKPMTELLEEGKTIEEIIKMYFPDAEILDRKEVRYYCDCSKEHYGESLATLPNKDLDELIAANEPAEIRCRYCDKVYHFSVEELQKIRDDKCSK